MPLDAHDALPLRRIKKDAMPRGSLLGAASKMGVPPIPFHSLLKENIGSDGVYVGSAALAAFRER